MRFRSFQVRVLTYFLVLSAAVLAITLAAVNTANRRTMVSLIGNDLVKSGEAFRALMAEQDGQLRLSVAPLSRALPFAKAVSLALDPRGSAEEKESYRQTVTSSLLSIRDRTRANLVTVVADAEGFPVVADLNGDCAPGAPFANAELVATARDSDDRCASAFVVREGNLYREVVISLDAPTTIAWYCIAFRMDDAKATELKAMIGTDVTFLRRESGRWTPLASSVDGGRRRALASALAAESGASGGSRILRLGADRYVALDFMLSARLSLNVVLQRSLEEALQPFRRLTLQLLALGAVGLGLTGVVGLVVARMVTGPVLALAAGARRINEGRYDVQVAAGQEDEIGELGRSFNDMARGLAERDRVRSLLGMVVSPAIADELLKRKEVELGGEVREVAILFSDIRGFTALSEGRPPSEVIGLLNRYLTIMSAVIDAHSGVVDKFEGDAIMALFGAPIRTDADTDHAFEAALAMVKALDQLNGEFRGQGLPELSIGIGINTGPVVAGNVGSPNRLNYTAIGDAVNLASRLEGLTKEAGYEARIIVSDASLERAKMAYRTRPLGEVMVKGKSRIVKIHALDSSRRDG